MNDDRLPWFPCYPGKLLGALAGMRLAEGYVYMIALLRIYESGGVLKDSLQAISTRTGLNRRIVSEALDSLFKAGRLCRDADGIRNPVADTIIAEAHALHEKRIMAGKSGGTRRAEKAKMNQGKRSSKATPGLEPGSTNNNNSNKEESLFAEAKSPSTKNESDWPPNYRDLFWATYPRKTEKKAALAKLDAIYKTGKVPWVAFWAGLQRYIAYVAGTEERFIKHATTWLNRGCWDDEHKAGGDYGKARGPDERLGFAGLAAKVRYGQAAHGQEAGHGEPAGSDGPDNGRGDSEERVERMARDRQAALPAPRAHRG